MLPCNSNSERKSVANTQLLESKCTFRSPSRYVDGDMAQTGVSNSDSSDKKADRSEFVFLGGRYTNTNWSWEKLGSHMAVNLHLIQRLPQSKFSSPFPGK